MVFIEGINGQAPSMLEKHNLLKNNIFSFQFYFGPPLLDCKTRSLRSLLSPNFNLTFWLATFNWANITFAKPSKTAQEIEFIVISIKIITDHPTAPEVAPLLASFFQLLEVAGNAEFNSTSLQMSNVSLALSQSQTFVVSCQDILSLVV